MKYINAFEKIRESMKQADTSSLSGDFAIQVNISNKDCAGAFYVAYFNGVLAVEPYDYKDHWAMITVSVNDFIKLVSGKLDIDKAVSSGKLMIEGDESKVRELAALVKEEPKKSAAKKAPVKKKAEKSKSVAAAKPEKTAKAKAVSKPAAKKTAAVKNEVPEK